MSKPGLPPAFIHPQGNHNGEDNELETWKQGKEPQRVSSRIVWPVTSRILRSKAKGDGLCARSTQETGGDISEIKKTVQAPKVKTKKKIKQTNKNQVNRTGDLTANHRSGDGGVIVENKTSKDSSQVIERKSVKSSDKNVKVYTALIEKCADKENKYNNLVNVISDPIFLLHSYKQIKSNPGNMPKGTTEETLDEIDPE